MITAKAIARIRALVEARGDRIGQGLSDGTLRMIQDALGTQPPELWTSIWTSFCPLGEGWPDWNSLTAPEAESFLRAPIESVESDVMNGLWLPEWGERPQSSGKALQLFKSKLMGMPALMPLRGHRCMSCDRPDRTGPVFSVMGFDTIFAASDLTTWFEHEFAQDCDLMSLAQPPVPFWGDLASGEVTPIRLPALFR